MEILYLIGKVAISTVLGVMLTGFIDAKIQNYNKDLTVLIGISCSFVFYLLVEWLI